MRPPDSKRIVCLLRGYQVASPAWRDQNSTPLTGQGDSVEGHRQPLHAPLAVVGHGDDSEPATTSRLSDHGLNKPNVLHSGK